MARIPATHAPRQNSLSASSAASTVDGAMNPGIDETPRAVLDRPARGVFAPVKVHPDSQMRQLAATTPLSSIRSRKPSFVGARRPT